MNKLEGNSKELDYYYKPAYVTNFVGIICTAEKEELEEAEKEILHLLGTGYYGGDGDEFLSAALKFIREK